ncbi:MAG: homoserine dehydrogenase [bacterium]
MRPVQVGLLGLGTVGGGTLNVLHRNAAEISRRVGADIRITHAAAREYDPETLDSVDGIMISDDAFSVVKQPDVDIVVELIGGYSPARELVLEAIANGKHVVTANKALIAMHGNEIFEAAEKHGVMVAYEAAVAGGIPIIKAVREGLAANHIEWIVGIINGTGNFILSEMREKGREFADVLKEAQALGYAEADPTFDVEGIDAAHKLSILASIAYGVPLQFDRCYTEGISKIEPEDLEWAEVLGYRIKHLGITSKTDNGIELRVHPTLIPADKLIANVNGVMNAVEVMGDAVGSTLYYGAGAGALPTASAVIADIIDVARMMGGSGDDRVPALGFQNDAMESVPVMDIEEVETAYYLRMNAEDIPGVLAQVTSVMADAGISIEAVEQKEPHEGETVIPLVMLTHTVKEKQMNAVIETLEALDTVQGSVARIRVEHL